MAEWTDEEKRAFTKIEEAGSVTRLAAIRLYRRCGSDLEKALDVLAEADRLAGRVPYALQNWEARKLATKRS